MSGDVLLTGATGFIGMELVARYLERGQRRLITLVRADDDAAAQARIDGVLTNLFGARADRYRGRVRAVAADLTAPGLGIARQRRERLAAGVTTIVHGAATVTFDLPVDEARSVNVDGTRRMLEFARTCPELRCYGHLSTAYVAGTHSGSFGEGDLDRGQTFHNSYEQSKFEAEQLVRKHDDLPFTILRPSIVVGDSHSGWTAAFNVLYWPLRAFARGLFTAVPAEPSAPVDVVSVDYVADAVHALCEEPVAVGQTLHLTAGPQASTMGEIAQLASRYFRRPLPQVLSPADFAALPQSGFDTRALDAGRIYFPYFSMGAVFDSAGAQARLEPQGIRASPLREYMERLLDFATRSRWGKAPIARVDALV